MDHKHLLELAILPLTPRSISTVRARETLELWIQPDLILLTLADVIRAPEVAGTIFAPRAAHHIVIAADLTTLCHLDFTVNSPHGTVQGAPSPGS